MKTILVPLDFSKTSYNALEYAAELALETESKLVLLHAYHVPLTATDVVVMMPSLDDVEAAAKEEFLKVRNNLMIHYGFDLMVETVCKCGFAAEIITDYAESTEADFVVMGIRGTNLIEEKLIGSVATSVSHTCRCPVFIIPDGVKYKVPEKILLASDLKPTNKAILGPLKQLAGHFTAKVHVLCVEQKEEIVEISSAAEGIRLDHALVGTDHSFHFVQNENIAEAISSYIEKNQVDILAMIPREHNLIDKIFKSSVTKKMAFHSSVPLLSLHE